MDDLNFLHGGLGRKGKIIDFSVNINPLKYPKIKNLILKNIKYLFYYPNENEKAIKLIGKYFKTKTENIILGNGTSELIYLISYTFNPKTALIPVPTFSEYERAIRSVHGKINFLNLEEFKFPIDKAYKLKGDILFLCNPNNPTGNLLVNKEEIYKISKNFSVVVVDESFIEFMKDEERQTLVSEINKIKNLIVLRSFSKFFGLPGLRLGWAVGNKNIIKQLRANINPWHVNSLAEKIIVEIFKKENIKHIEKFKEKTHAFIEKEKKFIMNNLQNLDCKIYPSVTNFLLIKIPFDSTYFTEKLLEKGMFVRDCKNFRNLGNNYIRIGIRSHKDNEKFIDKFVEIFKELKK